MPLASCSDDQYLRFDTNEKIKNQRLSLNGQVIGSVTQNYIPSSTIQPKGFTIFILEL